MVDCDHYFFSFRFIEGGTRARALSGEDETREMRAAAREEKWNFLRLSEYKLAGDARDEGGSPRRKMEFPAFE